MPTLTLLDGMRAVRLKLYDEDSRKLIGWREARRLRSGVPLAAPVSS